MIRQKIGKRNDLHEINIPKSGSQLKRNSLKRLQKPTPIFLLWARPDRTADTSTPQTAQHQLTNGDVPCHLVDQSTRMDNKIDEIVHRRTRWHESIMTP